MSLAMMGFGSQALLAPVWGSLADAIGVRETLAVVGVVTASVTVLVGMSWLRMRRPASTEPSVFRVGPSAVGAELTPSAD